jgi:iron complex transport system substrate-binding protein
MKRRHLLAGLAALLAFPEAAQACDGQLIAEHVMNGPVCVPKAAQRIVTLDPLLTLGMFFELGVPVLATTYPGIQDDGLRKAAEAAKVADVGHPYEPSLERILALKPDLIIGGSYVHAGLHDKLSRIAPTLLIDHVDWKTHLRLVARIGGRAERAEADLAAYEKRAAAIKARMPDLKLSAVWVKPDGFNVFLDGPAAYAPYAVLREAGVKRTAYETTSDGTVDKRPDWEEIAALDGDVLFYVVTSGTNETPDDELTAETIANPLWQLLPAVRAGRSYRVDRATWMGFHGAVSAQRVLDDVERFILAKP